MNILDILNLIPSISLMIAIGVVAFFGITLVWIFFPSHYHARKYLLMICSQLFVISIILSWLSNNLAWNWVFIEASTLFGAVLISSPGREQSFRIAWKFLLINSYGLGIAFLGLILITFGSDTSGTLNLDILKSESQIVGPLARLGLTLAIYGFTAKLGLFPNHFWVADTYGDSPTQVSSLISSFIPVTVALVLRELVQLDRLWNTSPLPASLILPILGVITCMHATLKMIHVTDIRMIAAKIAVFHSGMLAWIVWLDLSYQEFLYILIGTMMLKVVVFLSMGILRMEAGSKDIEFISEIKNLNSKVKYFYFLGLFFAFGFPLSPAFIGDFLILKVSLSRSEYSTLFILLLNVIFAGLLFQKTYPIWMVPSTNDLSEKNRKKVIGRIWIVTGFSVLLVSWAIYGIIILRLI
ncbi:proton-conducting transporter transmembrane domain-containing protein [Leptospira sp. GIMC2001]|uniref:proton-conducting transporter transmembrane domain-containing protein n=1 Tax=Leptospira sp. GIMC2001 TaxID=1513297 RepID=UPI00234BAABC|nr:proton-conducting transporter membrane subunit [Leptospira sp. GIMC2001]WCL48840.1 proton-conducting transporter membrane subunit [Leptospira sp. GIMC2001]